jgi:hypothetical protein
MMEEELRMMVVVKLAGQCSEVKAGLLLNLEGEQGHPQAAAGYGWSPC